MDGNVQIGSCVYGAGARSSSTANTDIQITGNSNVGGDVYGGGLMGKLTGSTNVDITGSASIGSTVFGGADIGDRSSTDRNLVTGNSRVHVDGSDGATVGENIIGSGNSCFVSGDSRIILIEHYRPIHLMKSIQDATQARIIDSDISLTGRASSESALPSVLMSLYGIDDLRLIDGSKLSLSATMRNVKEYGSYKTVNGADTLTTSLNDANTVHLSSGIMFNTAYDSTNDYEKYGPIKGYTILSRDLTGDYGAFAYGETNSPGRLWTINGVEIDHISRAGETKHDPFWLWIITGTERRNVAIVAEGNGNNAQGNTSAYVTLITLGDLVNERLVLNSGTL